MSLEESVNTRPRFSFKIIRNTKGATWELKYSDIPLGGDEAETRALLERGRKYAHQEFLAATNQIPVL